MFTIPMSPLSLQSSGKRMVIRNGKPLFFKNKKATDYINHIRILARPFRHLLPQKLDCPLDVSIAFYFDRPARLRGKKHSPDRIPHDKRPDLDNLQKSLQDALSEFWNDDAQIASLRLKKFYVEQNGQPRIVVRINRLINTNESDDQ